MSKLKSEIQIYLWILIASIIYGIGTSAFIFPCNITLGGTSGISVILTRFLSQSPGTIISILNVLLIKGFGVDFVIAQIVHMREKQNKK